MPNWTENRVNVLGDARSIKQFKEFVKGEDSEFSLNSILPMPDSLNIPASSTVNGVFEVLTNPDKIEFLKEVDDESLLEGRIAMANYILFQKCRTWYDWRNQFWGTKWDAHDVILEVDEDEQLLYYFNTPWNGPEGISSALRMMFPELKITWECLNEEDFYLEAENEEQDEGDGYYYAGFDENPNVYEI